MTYRKYILIIIAAAFMLSACNTKEKYTKNITDLQLHVDSILASAGVLTPAQRASTQELIDAYVAYAEKFPTDSLGAVYLFEAARLKGRLPDFEGAIALFRKVADNYPNDDLAPKSLLSIGGIYDVTLQDYAKAELAYRELKEKYPLQAQEYGIDMVLKTLGKSPEEILMELQSKNMDTLSILNAVTEEDPDEK